MTVDSEFRIDTDEQLERSAPMTYRTGEVPVTVIEPTNGWRALNLRELWRFRELLYFLTWRDVKVRYKQTVIGALWAILQPLLTMVIFTVVFSRLANVPSEGVPYPVFSYSALLPWTFFATALTTAGTSLVTNANMVSKIYFPRVILPISSVLGAGLDFAIAFVVLIGMMLYYGITPGWAVLTIPLFVLLAFLTSTGVSLWLSAINVKYRDVRYTIPFLTQVWLFLTPVAYPSSMIPEKWRTLYALNPMAGVVEGFRWALLGTENPPNGLVAVSSLMVIVMFVGGLFYFRRMEREFADVI
jgi:lipopolysaccharide transport system permease protein